MTDPDQNFRSGAVQTVTIRVTDPATGDQETVTLMESGPDTGVFVGSIALSSVLGAAQDDGFLKTATGNQVAASYTDPDFSPDTCAKSIIALAPGTADLRVTQSVDDSTPDEGQSIVYTVKVKNNGGPNLATSVVISDAAPAGINYIVGSATHGDFDYDTGTWMVGQLPVGVEAVLTIDAEVIGESGDAIVNTAFVQARDQSDPVPGNESATITVDRQPGGSAGEPVRGHQRAGRGPGGALHGQRQEQRPRGPGHGHRGSGRAAGGHDLCLRHPGPGQL